mmetsp:Transcript_121391/g.170690  ORF Transcript_121391/g.170690 Transcript_121391/m.170690 type:complete len:211 (-) Transcript_121391:29-661(-)
MDGADEGGSSGAGAAVFGDSAKLKQAIQLINTEIPEAKLPKLLQKILEKLHLADVKPFTPDEEEALADTFEVEPDMLTTMLDTISFLLETIAYKQLSFKDVATETLKAGLGENQAATFAKVWASKGPTVIEKLRNRAFFSREGTDVSWRLNLMLAQASQAKTKQVNAQFEVNVASKGQKDSKVQMEFTHSELFKFYTQLEIIQNQLDQLS